VTRFVLDCSVTMAWCFGDEATSYTNGVRDALVGARAVVPSLWPLEVANVLLVAERRHRLGKTDTARFLALLQALPITVDQGTSQRAFREILDVAREQELSSYDAAYLELALREGLRLATLDDQLKDAAARVGGGRRRRGCLGIAGRLAAAGADLCAVRQPDRGILGVLRAHPVPHDPRALPVGAGGTRAGTPCEPVPLPQPKRAPVLCHRPAPCAAGHRVVAQALYDRLSAHGPR
jgi:predicted nucleic acid-binding protein